MNKNQIVLKLVLDEIGFDIVEIGVFLKRKILQKKTYLLQLTGVDLGYRYNWYIYGPYCPALANDVFALREEIEHDKEFEEYELNPKTKKKLRILLDTILVIPPGIEEHERLELLASLHYLKHIAYWAGKGNPKFNEVFQKLIES
ncbi:unnamed protein product, partial [marine sediment metagenome]